MQTMTPRRERTPRPPSQTATPGTTASPGTTAGPADLPAGEFSSWLEGARVSLREETVADVPCGECVACCASSHFVHVRPEETDALARIPRELLFPAPGLPRGNVVMGYDEAGHCPMLTSERCSIYDCRPLTCRTYDCRVFAAAGIAADKPEITARARRWQFGYAGQDDRDRHAAVRAAAAFLQAHADGFPATAALRDPVRVALLAVEVYEVFAEHGVASDAEMVEAVLAAKEQFEAPLA